jgi:cysteinyl-tRNA synthetase
LDLIGSLLNIILKMREEARRRGDWATADRLRQQIVAAGIGLEDTPTGSRWYIASAEIKQSS